MPWRRCALSARADGGVSRHLLVEKMPMRAVACKQFRNIYFFDTFQASCGEGARSAIGGSGSMPSAAPKPCSYVGCGVLVRDGTSRCQQHQRPAWAKKPDAPRRTAGRRLQAQRAALFARQPLCVECERRGMVVLATQRDHIVPLAEGGTDDEDNVQGLCRPCHQSKSIAEALRARGR